MAIDDKAVKGRGASMQPPNRFEQRSYGVLHWEGVDIPEEEEPDPITRRIEVYPKTIVNRVDSPDLPFKWSLNPYQGCEHGCSYCYARPTHEYWGYSAGLDFERVVLVKRNAPELFERQLRQRSWPAEPINLAGATDPYQPLERSERLTRRILEIALAYGQPLMLITKNALIERDLDLLAPMASKGSVQVAISLTTLNEDLRRVMEPRTSTGLKRLRTIRALSEAGVPTMAMIAPIIPALNEQEVPLLLRHAAEAGAITAGYTVLRTNGAVKPVFEAWLRQHFPDRAAKIIAQTSDLHGGRMEDPRFGVRMRGEGRFATNIQRMFKVLRRRYFEEEAWPDLDRSHFRVPPRGQLDLFAEDP
ncbi:MAG: PA0069 family radical SAM protein [Flavobacteriales bacterium]|nr:PA0069 family radical SAM protein [Flavobacteriales bacterium]